MAALSPRQATGMSPTGSPRSEETLWNYAVPMEGEENRGVSDYTKRLWKEGDPIHTETQNLYNADQVNGGFHGGLRRMNSTDPARTSKSNQALGSSRLAPAKPKTLARQVSDISGANSSDADSLLELYNQSADASRGGSSRASVTRQQISNSKMQEQEDVESYWIHRDKLAQIESQELRDAGFRMGVRRGSRATSQPVTTTEELDEKQLEETQHEDMPQRNDQRQAGVADFGDAERPDPKRQRTMSPSRQEYEGGREAYVHHSHVSSQDDQTGEPATQRNIAQRPGGSRIPVSRGTTSPASVPDSPVNRSRKNSNAWTNPRSPNIGTVNNAESGDTQVQTPTQGRRVSVPIPINSAAGHESPQDPSPPKSTVKVKKSPASAVKNGARNVSGQKQREPSAPNSPDGPGSRPRTRDGPRPATARPEGDPPWIATMYKPDPRLPPDQQMLPTHAKRLAQEQQQKFERTNKESVDDANLELRLVDSAGSSNGGAPHQERQADSISQSQQQYQPSRSLNSPLTHNHPQQIQPQPQYQPPLQYQQQPQYQPQQIQPQPQYQPPLQYQQQPQYQPQPQFQTPQTFNQTQQQTPPQSYDNYNWEWPLKTPSPPDMNSPTKSDFPAESGRNPKVNDRTINTTLPMAANGKRGSQRLSQLSAGNTKQKAVAPIRMQESPDDEKKRKKDCGCCAVM